MRRFFSQESSVMSGHALFLKEVPSLYRNASVSAVCPHPILLSPPSPPPSLLPITLPHGQQVFPTPPSVTPCLVTVTWLRDIVIYISKNGILEVFDIDV